MTPNYGMVNFTSSDLRVGTTTLEIAGYRKFNVEISSTTFCTARMTAAGKVTVTVPEGTNIFIKPTIDLLVYTQGKAGLLKSYSFDITSPSLLAGDFWAGCDPIHVGGDSSFQLNGPSGNEYKILLGKHINGVLDSEFIRTPDKWIPVNKNTLVEGLIYNPVKTPLIRVLIRSKLYPQKVVIANYVVETVEDNEDCRTFTTGSKGITLSNICNVRLKGGEPRLTLNPYVGGVILPEGRYDCLEAPTEESQNIAKLKHDSNGKTLCVAICYSREPYLEIMEGNHEVIINKGRTIWKKNDYVNKNNMPHIPFALNETDVVMCFDYIGKVNGPIMVLLRKPTTPSIWVKGADTRITMDYSQHIVVRGGTNPYKMPKLTKVDCIGGHLQIDSIGNGGFVQVIN